MRAFKIWVCQRPDATVMKWLILQIRFSIDFKTYDIKKEFWAAEGKAPWNHFLSVSAFSSWHPFRHFSNIFSLEY